MLQHVNCIVLKPEQTGELLKSNMFCSLDVYQTFLSSYSDVVTFNITKQWLYVIVTQEI